ncbi:methyltransferase family protein [Thermomonospora catenispora]|uniref:methyltransferase family protein n=1 Tax=Thermomonospora catenispora TaxID=2493090 RepID=UPI00111D1D3B|nr:methyltransferase [Thermomonospora catenispora]TNY35111.1 isoprenylcysteine carboxylmethyltransferase family protein [Thermomonospora catenispora]
MTDPALVRAVALFVPVLAVAALLRWRPPGRAEIAAVILGTGWNVLALAVVNAVALRVGWWRFHVEGGAVAGVPVDLLLGWAVLWGGVAVLALRRLHPLLVGALAVWLDLAVMPLGEPVVLLGPSWLTGEAVAALLALAPGLLLARWTLTGRRLMARVAMQGVVAVGLMAALPIALSDVPERPVWALGLVAQALLVPAAVAAAAVGEFARAGRGTPLPYDPPSRLVTTGPYAYLRNPMQTAMTLTYLIVAPLDPVFLLGAAVAVSYGAGLAAWHEEEQLRALHGPAWTRYRAAVRPWLPRPRPCLDTAPAVLWIAGGCDRCSPLAAWIARRSPVALEVRDAETHPRGLRRMAYERLDGVRAEGVAAWARAVGHLHLGWALLGWILLLPGVLQFAQLCADAFGAGPALHPVGAVSEGPSGAADGAS